MGTNESSGNGWASGLFLLVFGIFSFVKAVTNVAQNGLGFTLALIALGVLLCGVALFLLYGFTLRILRALSSRSARQASKGDSKSNLAA